LTNVPITIPSNLSIGIHNFHIRSKQNPWSIDNAKTFNVGGVVPNTWSFITAKLQAAQILVTWGTEQEVNSLKFDVERSVNGIQFNKIGEQQAAGNSSTLKTYSFVDTKPETGFNYYRVKQIDVDGSVHYSAIVKVLHTQNIKEAFIAPNPVVDVVNLVEPIATNINTLEVYDSKGTLVLRKVVNSAVQLYSLPVTNLPTGKYVLKINYGKRTKSLVFVK
jgi:Secretion system C-terminal sorting domain